MSFLVSEQCLRLGLRPGAIAFRGVSVSESSSELRERISAEIREIRKRFPSPADLRTAEEIVTMHGIFRSVGVNPRKVKPACERLLQYAMKRGDLPAINNLVDAYNLIALRFVCSLGAHDLDTLTLPVCFRLLRGDETFTPLGNEDEEPITPGEFAYVDAADRVICRLDVVQGEFSKVTHSTTDALLIVGGTTAHSPVATKFLFSEVTRMITDCCGGEAEVIHFPY